MKRSNVEILAVPGIPLVRKDDDLVALIREGVARGGIMPRSGDVFVLTQKIVSKAEGRMVDLATVEPSAEAIELAGKVRQAPRLVELIPRRAGPRLARSNSPAKSVKIRASSN